MITTWQDFDENFRSGWGLWWAIRSENGHIVRLLGGYETEAEAIAAVGSRR